MRSRLKLFLVITPLLLLLVVIILSVNGIAVLEGDASLDSIYESVSKLKPGKRVVIRVLHAGQVIELSTVITP